MPYTPTTPDSLESIQPEEEAAEEDEIDELLDEVIEEAEQQEEAEEALEEFLEEAEGEEEEAEEGVEEEEEEAEDDDEDTFPDEPTSHAPSQTNPKYLPEKGSHSYNALKTHQGQIYSGMTIGSSHTWTYEPGTWKETKQEPDLWEIDYRATKRRAGKKRLAPRGSGAPVGTEYHWLIVGHQHVKKLDANTYETSLTGSKYKLAHKNVSSNSWSVPTVKGQREREVELLDDAKRRVQGLPPVLGGEKVKVEGKREKGQQRVDTLFGMSGSGGDSKGKRKRDDDDE